MADDLRESALHYHSTPRAGKVEVVATKPLASQYDLSLAYSPGVAAPCEAIAKDPAQAARYTSRSNLVAVISNGTAVLGLGAIGPLASKPVMEGKGVLFKKFGGIDVFDIEVEERDPDRLVDIIASLEPTFGGINLEDIKAPECFHVERKLRERMNIPVFHDDQHGTAIIAAAALLNALKVVDKNIDQVRLVASGAGAAGIACLDLLVSLGLPREHIVVTDSRGVIYQGRKEGVDERKARYAARTEARTLADAVAGADVFLGVSQPGLLTGEMVLTMNERPVIFALANPIPEILPEEVKAVRDDAVIATGRSDYPNQVNNVLCFPYIFRGALDAGATVINEDMKLACVRALAALAQVEPSDEVMRVYGGQTLHFGPEYLIPKPFDPRLMTELPVAVARAAMDSGVATRPIGDFSVYRERLSRFVFRTGLVMKPVFESAKESPRRVIYAEGEDERVLRAVQTAVEEGYASPMLIGRRHVIQERACRLGLTMRLDEQVEVIDPQNNPHYDQLWQDYHRLLARHGVAAEDARFRVRGRPTVLAALMVRNGLADAMICGNIGRFHHHVDQVRDIIGLRDDVQGLAAMNALVLPKGTYFICDTDVNTNPTAEEVADMAELAAEEVRRFGLTPRLALLSQSNFGTSGHSEAGKMARARELLVARNPDLQVDGEMQGDLALLERLRHRVFPFSQLEGEANLLIMPNADAGNIAFSLLKTLADGVGIGPILLGTRKPAHVLTPSATVRRILNMTAVAVVDSQWREQGGG